MIAKFWKLLIGLAFELNCKPKGASLGTQIQSRLAIVNLQRNKPLLKKTVIEILQVKRDQYRSPICLRENSNQSFQLILNFKNT